jgi:hypothetical protein
MEIQVGDRFTDEEGEWEVVTHPASLHGDKSLRARVQRPGLPESEREITWLAHERVNNRTSSVSLLTELNAFFTEHMRCGELDAGVDGPVVWIACECGARMARRVDESDALASNE